MKFRSKLVDIGCIHQLTKILGTISKITKTCTLILSEQQVVFTQNERATGGGASLWCELKQVDFFEDYRIEGKDDNNQIYLEIINENLLRALKSGQNAQCIKIKLVKKQTPCLMFEVSLPSMTAHTRVVVHDIPVAVIPTRFWENFQRPILPAYDIKISLPNLKILKNIIERMKNISGFMVLSASQNGNLSCKVETEEVTATTYFSNMEIEKNDNNMPHRSQRRSVDIDEDDELVEARIDVQKLVTFLNVQQFNANKVMCGIVNGQSVHMFLQCGDMFFQYFIPAMNVSIL
ncbi:checkpoint protein HUS1-like isoform X1 [Clytia hemisphaerica]|uniref:Checkpoint protein n=1 Tax=Clytia hemisphaerica TaxID=252671 RepID=A0A7M5V590_9CNID|eukprot:TCONS_00061981-protein